MKFKNDLEKQRIKKYAEVFTPTTLVCEMLDLLPNDVWYNPNLKWLDPCNGLGAFTLEIINRLMIGLEECIPDPEVRYRHIITNMIYVCEIQETSAISFSSLFEIHINQYNGDYLSNNFKYHCSSIWNVEKFDIIVMNPPYQRRSDESYTKSKVLWDRFVKTAILNDLKEDGYLVAVHPNGWRNIHSRYKELHMIFRNTQFLYLEFHTVKDGLSTFKAATPYDFYCLQNTIPTKSTIVKCIDNSIIEKDIHLLDFIPNGKFDEFEYLITDDLTNRVTLLYDRKYSGNTGLTSRIKSDTFKYPIVYIIHKDGSINFVWSSVNNRGHFGVPKVIWSNGAATCPILDIDGKYGLCDFSYAIVDGVELLEKIKYAMNHPRFIELMEYCSNGTNHKFNHKVISLFRKDFWKEFQSEY